MPITRVGRGWDFFYTRISASARLPSAIRDTQSAIRTAKISSARIGIKCAKIREIWMFFWKILLAFSQIWINLFCFAAFLHTFRAIFQIITARFTFFRFAFKTFLKILLSVKNFLRYSEFCLYGKSVKKVPIRTNPQDPLRIRFFIRTIRCGWSLSIRIRTHTRIYA